MQFLTLKFGLLLFALTASLYLHAESDLNCDPALLPNFEINQTIEQELEALNESQQSLARFLQKDWLDNVWDKNKHFNNPGIYNFLRDDSKGIQTLKALGFQFNSKDRHAPFVYPETLWLFLRKAETYVAEQENKVVPGVIIQNIYTNEYRFITKPSDLPKDCSGWHSLIKGFLDQETYYQAIAKGILPITLNGEFSNGKSLDLEDHEFQHLLSLYHPDTFPSYMHHMKEMSELYLNRNVSSKTLFLFSEAFAFVRKDDQKKEHFKDFYEKWVDKDNSYEEIHKAIHSLSLNHLELLSKEFLEMFPSLVEYRGGLIRDSILIPGSLYPHDFAGNWKASRSNPFSNEEFAMQNWRNLYMYLVLAHNLSFKQPVDSLISLTHMGWDYKKMKEHLLILNGESRKEEMTKYLRFALVEMIWMIHQSYHLGMTTTEVMKAAINPSHPQHQKVVDYFKSAYASSYNEDEKQKSIYYKTIIGK